jgi:glycosyltransferase involved in cell wall biosynthesis
MRFMERVGRAGSALAPARISELVYTSDRGIDVDYDSLDYEVHVPTFNEEYLIEETLESLVRQDPVQNNNVDIVLVDSHSEDRTVELAKPYVDEIVVAPMGKLSARNEGIRATKPDVVLSADAGDIYPKGWINEIAKPFEDEDTVASYGPVYSKEPLFRRPQKIKHSIVNLWNLPGNNSAIRVNALRDAEGFHTDIDQQKLLHVLLEEQIMKKMELRLRGDIRFRPYAGMYKCQRRKMFSLERTEQYEEEMESDERF